MLLCLLESFNLFDRLPLSESLSILHLLFAELNLFGLLFLLRLDVLLELSEEFLNIRISIAKHFGILLETVLASDHLVVVERLATDLEEVDGVLDVSLSK